VRYLLARLSRPARRLWRALFLGLLAATVFDLLKGLLVEDSSTLEKVVLIGIAAGLVWLGAPLFRGYTKPPPPKPAPPLSASAAASITATSRPAASACQTASSVS
jgi:hypothetical protein